jgi:hypothetical protein
MAAGQGPHYRSIHSAKACVSGSESNRQKEAREHINPQWREASKSQYGDW